MQLVVDANVLFAAAIKEGKTVELLFLDELGLFTPEFVLEELEKHRSEILEKTHRPADEFDKFLSILFERIRTVSSDSYKSFEAEANSISPDPGDVPYFALALELECPIWSNDKSLKKQSSVKVFSTADIVDMLNL